MSLNHGLDVDTLLKELYLGRRKEMEAAQGRVREELKAEKEARYSLRI